MAGIDDPEKMYASEPTLLPEKRTNNAPPGNRYSWKGTAQSEYISHEKTYGSNIEITISPSYPQWDLKRDQAQHIGDDKHFACQSNKDPNIRRRGDEKEIFK
jgi:hypothetical protein